MRSALQKKSDIQRLLMLSWNPLFVVRFFLIFCYVILHKVSRSADFIFTKLYNTHVADPNPGKSCETFSPDAFKEAFFWPSAVDRKTTKNKILAKISSVMSSEDWREHERLKLADKQKLQAEKDARKAAREAKKLETAKMASEKLVLKEQKLAAAKKAAQTNTDSNKRSRKATTKGKKLRK